MITIPDLLWQQLLREFARHDPRVERVAYLDGVRVVPPSMDDVDSGLEYIDSTDAVATTLTLPAADLTPGNFTVSAAAMSEAGRHLRRWSLSRLVQVHTHGDSWVDHSSIDDRDAYSQRVGAVSIVLPQHARYQQGLEGAGVHVRDRMRWVRLADADIASYLRLVPSLADLRNPTCLTSATVTAAPLAANSVPATPRRRWPWRWLSRRT